MAPNILYTILFIVNCNECQSAEFIGQTSVPYKRIGMHFDLINSNNTSSDAAGENQACGSVTCKASVCFGLCVRERYICLLLLQVVGDDSNNRGTEMAFPGLHAFLGVVFQGFQRHIYME